MDNTVPEWLQNLCDMHSLTCEIEDPLGKATYRIKRVNGDTPVMNRWVTRSREELTAMLMDALDRRIFHD